MEGWRWRDGVDGARFIRIIKSTVLTKVNTI